MPAIVRDPSFRGRGAALLWTLAVLVLALTATLTVAQLTATTAARRSLDQADQLAANLLPGAEQAITHWLELQAPTVILPPDAEAPQLQVLDDLILIDDRQWRLTITAFDQCGMAPLRAILAGSPLRLAVDDELLAAVDAMHLDEQSEPTPLGLDLLEGSAQSSFTVYPRPQDVDTGSELARAEPLIFASSDRTATPSTVTVEASLATPSAQRPLLALGSVFGTHTGKNGPINVNTAPGWLLDAAMRQAGRGGLEQILDNRAAGRSSPVPPAVSGIVSPDESSNPKFVSTSELWSFRIDARCAIRSGGRLVGASWWVVYQRSSSSTSPWACVQRLAITD